MKQSWLKNSTFRTANAQNETILLMGPLKILLLVSSLLCFFSCNSPDSSEAIVTLASGRLERLEQFPTKFLAPRNVDVWLPEGYTADQKYAVLYMHDGQMLFDSTTTWNGQEWGADETMGQLLAQEAIRNTIVVGIWNTEWRHSEYFPEKPFASLPQVYRDSLFAATYDEENGLFRKEICSDNYLRFLTEELKPYIDQNFSTLPDQQNTFIAGSSMGGLISIYALCEYPEVFGAAACLSTHWVGIFDTLNNPIPQHFVAYLQDHLPTPETHRVYFDYGTATLDALYEPYQMMVDSVMEKKGYTTANWVTRKFPGENHSEIAWQKRLSIPLLFLLEE